MTLTGFLFAAGFAAAAGAVASHKGVHWVDAIGIAILAFATGGGLFIALEPAPH
jgi:predicted branched-subunit amino acid permease